jgi:Na+-translocating ferredoxin:NAD+ oxidoreductase RnfG subunit
MFKFLFILMGLGGIFNPSGHPLWTAHQKQVSKELTGWLVTFEAVKHKETIGVGEYFQIFDQSGQESGTLILSFAQGRFDRFDFMVVADTSKKIKLIRILKYRSEYGAEITNKKWLSQFYEENATQFILHKNIDAISGATFSANSLVKEINSILDQLN